MLDVIRRNPGAFVIALLMHLLLVVFLVVGVDWRKKPKPLDSRAHVVQAKVIDASQVEREIARLREEEKRKQLAEQTARKKEQQRLEALRKRREEEKRRLAQLERERKAREKAAAEAKRKAEAEKKRLAELKRKEQALKKRQEAERKRQAELEKRRKREAEKRRKAEEARKKAEAEKRRKAAEEKRKKAEAEKRRKLAEEKRKKAEAEKRRKAEEAARKKREAAARAKAEAEARERELQAQFEAEQRATEAARIVRLIQEKVARNWNPPPGTLDKGLSCRINVRLGSSGSVLAVSVVKSSGNAAFDRSVEAAVWKADPLPMPDDPGLRDRSEFRNHTFTFDPSRNRNR